MKSPRVRPAAAEDTRILTTLARETFVSAFAADNDPRDLDSYVRDAFSAIRMRREIADAANHFFLAFDAANVAVGYAKLRAGEAESCVQGPNPIELERIYVMPTALGAGVGALLMKASLELAEELGHETIWLGVWEENRRALAFYRKWSFREVGTHTFQLGSDPQIDLVLERPLQAAG